MKNVAPIQLYQFDKIKLSHLPLTTRKVNSVIVKIVLSTTNPSVSSWESRAGGQPSPIIFSFVL
jgi:hypothetical protein